MRHTRNEKDTSHTDQLIKAVFFCICAHFLLFVMGWSGKYLANTHHVVEIAFWRNLITFVIMLAFILISRQTNLFRTKKPYLIALRGLIGTISLFGVFASLHHLPMAYATVLFFTSTLITPVLAFLFLKEKIGMHRWTAIIFGLIGVIIIARPTGEFSMLGLFLALATACMHGSVYTILRALKSENPLTITFYFVTLGFILPGLFMPWIGKPVLPHEILPFLTVGIAGGLGQLSLTSAYKYAPASFITPIGYTSILWNVAADIFYWKYDISLLAVFAGTGLILCAQIYMIRREHKNRKTLHNAP